MADRNDELYVTLKEYADLRWRDHEKVHQAKSDARDASHVALDRRLEQMQGAIEELRDVINELRNSSLPREIYDQRHRELDERIQTIERDMVRQEALDFTSSELARTRKALAYTIIGGVTITLVAAFVDVLIRLAH